MTAGAGAGLGAAAPIVSIEGVHKSFGSNKVLDDVSLNVTPGDWLVIAGPSESGKSTLLRCINQLERIDQGRIVVDGMVVGDRTTSINRLRSEVGMVFQSFNLFPYKTVLEIVTMAACARCPRGSGRRPSPSASGASTLCARSSCRRRCRSSFRQP